MTTQNIDIVVTEEGSRTVRRNLEGVEQGAASSQRAVELLSGALGAVAGAGAVAQLNGVIESYKTFQTTLGTVTSTTADLIAANAELFAGSGQTGSFFETLSGVLAGNGEKLAGLSESFLALQGTFLGGSEVFGQVSGALSTASGVFTALSGHADTLGGSIEILSKVLDGTFAKQAIGSAVTALNVLKVAVVSNPLGALALAITTIVALLIGFSDQIGLGEGKLSTLKDLAAVVFEDMKAGAALFITFFQEKFAFVTDFAGEVFGRVATFFEDNFGFIGDFASSIFEGVDFSIEGVLTVTARVIDKVVSFWRGAFLVIREIFGTLPTFFKNIFTKAINAAIEIVQPAINKLIEGLNFLLPEELEIKKTFEFKKLPEDTENTLAATINRIPEIFAQGQTNFAEEALNRWLEQSELRALENAPDRPDRPKNVVETMQTPGLGAAGSTSSGTAITGAPPNAVGTLTDATGNGGVPSVIDQVTGDGKDGLNNKSEELTGLAKGLEEVKTAAEELGNKAFKGAEDALVSLVTTGKGGFKALANSIIADLARLAIQALILAPIKAFLGNTFGLKFMADGGIIGGPTAFALPGRNIGIAGEAGPEAILPLQRTRGGQLGVAAIGAGGGMGPTQVNINVEAPATATAQDREGADRLAERIGHVVRKQIDDRLSQQTRPGGVLTPRTSF